MWSGELSIIALQLSMFITTMEEEIVDVNVRLNQVVRQQVSRTSSGICSFEFPEAWVATSFDHHLLTCHG